MTAMDRRPRNRYPDAAHFLAAVVELAFIRPGEKELLARLMGDLFRADQQAMQLNLTP